MRGSLSGRTRDITGGVGRGADGNGTTRGGRGLARSSMKGLQLTFAVLSSSEDAQAERILVEALKELDARVQTGALEAMLARGGTDAGWVEAVASLHLLSTQAAGFLVEHIDDILPVLRDLFGSVQVQTRANAVELACRSGKAKLSYLLVRALEDEDERVAERALSGLEKLARRYHQQVERARLERTEEDGGTLEGRKFALIEPLLEKLGPVHTGTCTRLKMTGRLLELSMGLDWRTDDLIFRILMNSHDSRSPLVTNLLDTSSSAQGVSFILEMLRSRNADKSGRALALLERREDAAFVRELLRTDRLFTDAGLRRALKGLRRIGWLEGYGGASAESGPSSEMRTVLSESRAMIRAMHMLVLSGVEPRTVLEGIVQEGPNQEARETAAEVLDALASGKDVEQISAALTEAEQRAASSEENAGGHPARGRLAWAREGIEEIPRDAFQQFCEAFDHLDPETRTRAGATLRRLEENLDELLTEALTREEAEVRLKAVRMVKALAREGRHEETLVALVDDPDERVRATAVKVLSTLGSESAVRALVKATTDPDRRVVANTTEAIEATGFPELTGLTRILARHPNNRIRANAVKALLQTGQPGAGEMLEDMLKSPGELMRLSGVWVLGEVNWMGRLWWLRKLSRDDPSTRVRQKAREILGDIG